MSPACYVQCTSIASYVVICFRFWNVFAFLPNHHTKFYLIGEVFTSWRNLQQYIKEFLCSFWISKIEAKGCFVRQSPPGGGGTDPRKVRVGLDRVDKFKLYLYILGAAPHEGLLPLYWELPLTRGYWLHIGTCPHNWRYNTAKYYPFLDRCCTGMLMALALKVQIDPQNSLFWLACFWLLWQCMVSMVTDISSSLSGPMLYPNAHGFSF